MKHKISFFSMLYALCSMLYAGEADAALRVSNSSQMQQVAAAQAAAAQQLADTYYGGVSPAEVAANPQLSSCAMIYPNGEFTWASPDFGIRAGANATCVAVVELRAIRGNSGTANLRDANAGDILLARGYLAAGDAADCNISAFPESGYLADAGNFIFPADAAPTVDDVEKVLATEQKQNASLKIAAGVIGGALLGNMAGKNDVGDTGLLGTGGGKIGGAVVGALGGGAIMAGSSYAGKVGGDIILSTGINAVAGGIVGNMMANGKSRLRIEECTDLASKKTTCLWGVIEKGDAITDKTMFYNLSSAATMVCDKQMANCESPRLVSVKINNGEKTETLENAQSMGDTFFNNIRTRYEYKVNSDGKYKMTENYAAGEWVAIESAMKPKSSTMAMITDFEDTAFGLTTADFDNDMRNKYKNNIVGRRPNGTAFELSADDMGTIYDFYPMTVDASDGRLIDVSNKARLGATAKGAGIGAGIGAFTAYQGATDEVQSRWAAAVTEYKDSLQKVYCQTGTRFLSHYNDIIAIPNMR